MAEVLQRTETRRLGEGWRLHAARWYEVARWSVSVQRGCLVERLRISACGFRAVDFHLRLLAFPVKLPAISEISHPGIEFPKKSSVVLESR